MKNKKVTYLLLVAVAVVWGLVIYQFFNRVGGGDMYVVDNYVAMADNIKVEQDTFEIVANYRDPFLGTMKRANYHAPLNGAAKPKKKPEPKPEVSIDWTFLSYTGKVANTVNDKSAYGILIYNDSYIMSKGDEVQGVTLDAVYGDSVRVIYQNQKKVLKLDQ